ncbi:MAG: CDP-glycerol glycerophosphotransferase family protein, partial [Clostridia bacterium]|nr:CDP-glycerol glycerophosphotransferase family protein [Clostridia bacterium]
MKLIWKIIKNIPDMILNFLFIPIWHLCGLFKRDKNLWLFVSWFGNKYNDSSRVLYEYVNANCSNITPVWISKDKKIVRYLREKGFKAYSSKSIKALYLTMRASKLFSTTGYEMFFGFTKGIEFYELWHGMPLKKILNDDEFSGGNIRKNVLGKILYKINYRFFVWKTITTLPNLYTFSNALFFNTYLKTAFNITEDRILNLGLPRNDALLYHNDEKLISEIKYNYPNSKIILYMPTFRTSAWTKEVFN